MQRESPFNLSRKYTKERHPAFIETGGQKCERMQMATYLSGGHLVFRDVRETAKRDY
jgi:hypothetical protein